MGTERSELIDGRGGLQDRSQAFHYRHGTFIRRKSLVKSSDSLRRWLDDLIAGRSLSSSDWQTLGELELAEPHRALALGLTTATVATHLQQRATLLQTSYTRFCGLCQREWGCVDPHLLTLWRVWLPLAQCLIRDRQTLNRPLIQGILGGQGTGKSTLGRILSLIVQSAGYKPLSWSLDDLYKTYRDRLQLQQIDPDLIWRGPPGTHDIELGLRVLDQLRQGSAHPIAIPRFDKSLHHGMGDRVSAEWVETIDIVLFDGWFVGMQPIAPQQFDPAPDPIHSDRDRAFALTCNQRLTAYQPLWERLDRLWVLHPADYRLSKQWRKQAETAMKASGKSGMSDAEIDAFVDYFWTALHPALFLPPALQRADLIIPINPDHSPGTILPPPPVQEELG